MIAARKLLANRSASAAVEMALVVPLLLILLMGSIELGNYFYDEHKLVKAVRDGARYAARQSFSNYSPCAVGDIPTPGQAGTAYENTKLMVRTGTLVSGAGDLLPNWATATFQATIDTCTTSLNDANGTYNLGGIYADVTAPTVKVTVTLPYRSIIGSAFGFSGINMNLQASQSAAVMGF